MLRASYRVLQQGGVICFTVIAVADGLTAEEMRRAIEAGPPEVESGPGYPALMSAAGFRDIEDLDVSDDYMATAEAWLRSWEADAPAIRTLVGPNDFAERQDNLRRAIEATRAGLLLRDLIRAAKP